MIPADRDVLTRALKLVDEQTRRLRLLHLLAVSDQELEAAGRDLDTAMVRLALARNREAA